jgi:hypothetical protein
MRQTRREFLGRLAAAGLAAASSPSGKAAETKAPFRLLYNNDTTNLLGCTSPWHPRGAPFRPEMMEASVAEAAAADVQLLAPGLCEVPWWPSKVLPLAEHAAWFKERYGAEPDQFSRFILGGGDLVQLFVEACRARGIAPFISFRLNDAHHKEHVEAKRGDRIPGGAFSGLSQFYHDHPEYRIGPNVQSGSQHVLNWAIPEVRARKLAFLAELCERYDVEGLELDFLRYYSFFQLGETSVEQRRAIQAGFIAEVRTLLDRTARGGRHRWLSVRIPSLLGAFDPLGIDVAAFARAGVEMFNLSGYYPTEQQTDAPAIKQSLPDAAVYLELTQTTQRGENVGAERKYDDFEFRRTTVSQMTTTAHLAYARGLQGISLFNFAYFREHGTPGRGQFGEPPLAILPRLKDRAWLAEQPQEYFLARGAEDLRAERPLGSVPKPRMLQPGKPVELRLDLAAPSGGWKSGGRLRVEASAAIGAGEVRALCGEVMLESVQDGPPNVRAWDVPVSAVRGGLNVVRLERIAGEGIQLLFVELALA